MRLLFDQGVPAPLRRLLPTHEVFTAFEQEWNTLRNGELLSAAESAGFDLLITTDQNLRYQQNFSGRRIAVLVLLSTSWPRMQKAVAAISESVGKAVPGSYIEVSIP